MEENRRNIIIWKGNEHRSFVSSIYNELEFFYPAYRKAAQCISEIVEASRDFSKKWIQNGTVKEPEWPVIPSPYYEQGLDSPSARLMRSVLSYEQELLSYPNNIIAFCGKRGQGKTSAMVSMAKALEQLGRTDRNSSQSIIHDFWDRARQGISEEYAANRFCYSVLDPIDPTTMEQNDSVLRNVLSRLFIQFGKTWKKREKNPDLPRSFEKEKDALLEAFAKCYQSLDELKLSAVPERYDDLKRLSEVGDSVRMKRDFTELVQAFLSYEGAHMLVIQIDDADLNTSHTYEVMEDIRRYCVVPNVIILMALHLGTLRSCIEQQNVKNYRYLLRTDLDIDRLDRNRCREMAERYVDKLLPGRHQIHLPYVEDAILNASIEPSIQYCDNAGRDFLDFDSAFRGSQEAADIQGEAFTYENRLFRLIYEKTGVILMPTNGFLHNFMPKRFRELTHFLSFFSGLEGVDPSGKGSLSKLLELSYGCISEEEQLEREKLLSRRLQNLEELEIYFIQHWCVVNLTQSQVRLIEEIMQVPGEIKHTKTIECISRYIRDNGGNPRKFNFPREINYAAIIEVLNKLKSAQRYQKHYEFIYAIELYYTIYMHKLVCTRIRQQRDLRDLVSFCGYTIFPRHLYKSNNGMSGQFRFKISLLKDARAEGSRAQNFEDASWLWFLTLSKESEQPFEVKIHQDRDQYIRYSPEDAQFDIFHGLFGIIERYGEDLIKNPTRKDAQDFCLQLASVLQLICNYDVQYRVRKYCLEHCLDSGNEKRYYSDWAADLFLTIDALIHNKQSMLQKPELWEKYMSCAADYVTPEQCLPLVSSLNDLLNKDQEQSISLARNALDVIYLCQEDRHDDFIRSLIKSVLAQLNSAIMSIPDSEPSEAVQVSGDWWNSTRRNLFETLQNCLDSSGPKQFKTLFFTKKDDKIKNVLESIFVQLKDFDESRTTYDWKQMQDMLGKHFFDLRLADDKNPLFDSFIIGEA